MPASEVLDVIVRGKDNAGAALAKVKKGLKGVEKQASLSSRSIGKLQAGLAGLTSAVFSLKGMIATVGLSMIASSFVQAAATAEGYRTRLVTLMGDMTTANDLFAKMGDFASGVSFEYEEIIGSATTLAGVMSGGTKEIEKYMPIIADLAAASGLGIQETTSQVVRMYSAGAASADLFRERGILAMLGFQAGVSVSAEETKKRLIAAWEAPTSKIRGAADALSRTWEGMLSMMSDAWFQFRNLVMEAGVFDFMKATVSMLLDTIRKLKAEGNMESFAKSLGGVVVSALTKVIQVVAMVTDAFRGWKMIWNGLKATFATFAEFVNRGLAVIYDSLDYLVTGIGSAIKGVAGMIATIDVTGMSKGITDSLKETGSLLETMKGVGDKARENTKYWQSMGKEAMSALMATAGQETNLQKVNKLLGGIKKKAAEYAAAAKATTKSTKGQAVALKPQAKSSAIMKSEVLRMNELIQTNLAQMESYYAKGIIKLDEYYDNRKAKMDEAYASELAILKKAEGVASDPTKKLQIQDQIFKREQKYQRDTIKLADDRTKAEAEQGKKRVEIARTLEQLKARVEFDSATNISNTFRNQQAELAKRQSDEIQKLVEMKAQQEQIEEAHRLHELERDKQIADQRKQVQQLVLENMKQSLGFMESAFGDAYEASGKKVKEFFYAQKAVSIANTILSTYESAQKAYSSLAGIPVVGPALGIAAAGAAILAGMARVATMRTQALAAGGVVEGYSPSKTADNIPINATAGEFMHPVDTVKYYGAKAMEAIRRRMVPKEFLQGFSPQSFQPNYSYAMASGGSVPASPSDQKMETTIINMTDARELDQYLATPGGQNAVLNIISSRAPAVKRILR